MSNNPASEAPGAEAGDARALQMRLYREIGVSAVAAALAEDFAAQPIGAAVTDGLTVATVVAQKVAA